MHKTQQKMEHSSLNAAIYKLLELPENAAVIDLGCRDAGFLMGFMDVFSDKIKTALGVDITYKGFKNVKYKKPIQLKVMDCSGPLNLPDATYDFVFTKDMLECLSDKELFVKEVYRILKPGGTVICVNCDWDSIVYNGENKELISKAIHAYAVTKQPWMDDLDSWIGRREFGLFHKTGLFDSEVHVHNVVETEYRDGYFGYDFSRQIGWLAEEKTGVLTAQEYDDFIDNLKTAHSNGDYIFSKPYYIYKGIKKSKQTR